MLKKLMLNIRRMIIEFKVISTRILGYVSLINVGLMLFLTLTSLKDKGYIHFEIGTYIIPIYLAVMAIVFGVEYIELYFFKGLYEETTKNNNLLPVHPDIADMKVKLDEMYADYKKSKLASDNTTYIKGKELNKDIESGGIY